MFLASAPFSLLLLHYRFPHCGIKKGLSYLILNVEKYRSERLTEQA